MLNVPREDLLPRPTGGRLVVGARPITEEEWLPPDAAMLRERTMVRSAHPAEVFACMDGWGATVAAVFDALPLATPDDICILGKVNDRWVLVGGELCFPNRWVLHEKIGLPVLDIHGPVPTYAAQVGAGVDSLIDRLADGRIVERANWSISDSGNFFEPRTPPPIPDIDPAQLLLRVERQTLRRLGEVVVFSIRTYMEPMPTFVTRPRERVDAFVQVLRETPAEVRAYKSITTYVDPLCAYLTR
ncbi:MAG: DUF3445 domain-containing protein [Actinobacteria bacterium]|nr:DUF3445 domain-containing protein [Actinomycetota bacterium]